MQNNVIFINIIHFTQTGKYQIYCKKNAGHKKSAIFTDIIPHKRLYCTYIANKENMINPHINLHKKTSG